MRHRYVSFILASGSYCIPVDQVLQILRRENLIQVPKAPPFVEGVLNLRGDILPVIDLRARLDVSPGEGVVRPPADTRKRRIIITRVGDRSYGLDVDEVREIVEIDDGGITTEAATVLGARPDFVFGIARREESVYIVLDLPRVFATGRDVSSTVAGQT
jgi:purine-binding chemotaxis protein CheW